VEARTLSPWITGAAEPLPKDLKGACRALEGEFVNLLLRKMREAMVPKSEKGSGGFALDTARELLDGQWAQLVSQGEGIGLWRALYRQLEPEAVKSQAPEADEKGTGDVRPVGEEARPGAETGALRQASAPPAPMALRPRQDAVPSRAGIGAVGGALDEKGN
jgi:Rod binding domain-containing protein